MRSVSRVLGAGWLAVASFAAYPVGAAEPVVPRASDATYVARQNFVACVNGEAGRCDPARLTDAERKLVENASSQRNYVACANGWSAGCDPLKLTPDQKRIVDATAAQRSVAPCGSRWALGCGTPAGDSPASGQDTSAAGAGTQVSSGPPRDEFDTQRFYAPAYPAYEPRYSWSAASWMVPTALAVAATWPLWSHSYHYDYPWYWGDDWYGYPAWGWGWGWGGGWGGDHHHGGHGEHHDHGGGHHGGQPPTYRPPTVQPPLHPPPTYRPTPIQRSPSSSTPRPTHPIKRDWR